MVGSPEHVEQRLQGCSFWQLKQPVSACHTAAPDWQHHSNGMGQPGTVRRLDRAAVQQPANQHPHAPAHLVLVRALRPGIVLQLQPPGAQVDAQHLGALPAQPDRGSRSRAGLRSGGGEQAAGGSSGGGGGSATAGWQGAPRRPGRAWSRCWSRCGGPPCPRCAAGRCLTAGWRLARRRSRSSPPGGPPWLPGEAGGSMVRSLSRLRPPWGRWERAWEEGRRLGAGGRAGA